MIEKIFNDVQWWFVLSFSNEWRFRENVMKNMLPQQQIVRAGRKIAINMAEG